MNLIDVARDFPNEEACLDYLEKTRWPSGLACLKCGSIKVSRLKKKSERTKTRRIYQCLERPCRHQFTATTSTIFHDTHLPLRKWFLAIALICDAKKGISANQLKRHLKVQYRTAWYLAHRIRKAMEETNIEQLGGTVEADETFIGGRYDIRCKRRHWEKQAVMGLVERGGRVEARTIPNRSKPVLVGIIKDRVSRNAHVITDEFASYDSVQLYRKHSRINHIRAYVHGDVHTNTIENFWSLLKRGIIGSFHKVSIKHLPRYLAEFTYRFNSRHANNMFLLVLGNLLRREGMPYKELTAQTE